MPYEKQAEFHEAGAQFKERLLMAGNQNGKTFCAAHEVAMHATGWYPDWWKGVRYERPVLIWTCSETNETSKNIIQTALLGTEDADRNAPDFGTGAIPFNKILKITKRVAGVPNVIEQIVVKHPRGRSRISLKTYDQEVKKYLGVKVNLIWADELIPEDIYGECLPRIQAAENGRIMVTFTPTEGRTAVVNRFLAPEEGALPRYHVRMSIYDALHYTDEERKIAIDAYLPHERECRTYGTPMAGRGLVFPIDPETYKVDPFPKPRHWPVICGIDYGINHPAAAAWMWHDRGADILYLADCYKKAGETVPYHAAAIRARDPMTAGRARGWIPVVGPHDGLNTEKSSGLTIADFYWKNGVNMFPDTARYPAPPGEKEKGGRQDVEPILLELLERMQTGRFKVFSTCVDWFDEVRLYHRDDHNRIVPMTDDVISAVRAACMMIRYAVTQPLPGMRKKPVGRKVMARG